MKDDDCPDIMDKCPCFSDNGCTIFKDINENCPLLIQVLDLEAEIKALKESIKTSGLHYENT